jgi:hypothetical protein
MLKKTALILIGALLIGVIVGGSVIEQKHRLQMQKEARQAKAAQARIEQARAKRKAGLVNKINRYWQLREDAALHGIDTSGMPAMPYAVGEDGNIYQILPSGKRLLIPDDQFQDPEKTQGERKI